MQRTINSDLLPRSETFPPLLPRLPVQLLDLLEMAACSILPSSQPGHCFCRRSCPGLGQLSTWVRAEYSFLACSRASRCDVRLFVYSWCMRCWAMLSIRAGSRIVVFSVTAPVRSNEYLLREGINSTRRRNKWQPRRPGVLRGKIDARCVLCESKHLRGSAGERGRDTATVTFRIRYPVVFASLHFTCITVGLSES